MIVVFDHTVADKVVIDTIMKYQSKVNPLITPDKKMLRVDYSNVEWWDLADKMEAYTQDDERYRGDYTIINFEGKIGTTELVNIFRKELQKQLNEFWCFVTNNEVAQPVNYREVGVPATREMMEFQANQKRKSKAILNNTEYEPRVVDPFKDKKYMIDGKITTIKGEDRTEMQEEISTVYDKVFGLTLEQIEKVIEHEVNHIFVIEHCKEDNCYMRALYDTGDIDLITGFCNNCIRLIQG